MQMRNIMMRILLFLACSVVAYSCSNNGTKTHESGLQYKLLIENSEGERPNVGDIVAIKFKYTKANGETVEESDMFRMQLNESSHAGGSIEDALALMHDGDSAMFLIKAEDYYTQTRKIRVPEDIEPTEYLHFYIKMLNIVSFDEFEQERRAARISNERYEDKLLNDYLKRTNVKVDPTTSGLYYIEKEKGDGPSPLPGKKVTVHYMGYFIDGKIFDSSYKRNKPFTFKLGVGDAIRGLEEGVAKMKVGGKAQLIIPSVLAYGKEQVGPIPPYTTLVFDVELLSIE